MGRSIDRRLLWSRYSAYMGAGPAGCANTGMFFLGPVECGQRFELRDAHADGRPGAQDARKPSIHLARG